MANELHQLYLLTPVSLAFKVLWQKYHYIFKRLNEIEKGICKRIGITEGHIAAYDAEQASSGTNFPIMGPASKFKRDVVMMKIPSRKS